MKEAAEFFFILHEYSCERKVVKEFRLTTEIALKSERANTFTFSKRLYTVEQQELGKKKGENQNKKKRIEQLLGHARARKNSPQSTAAKRLK